MRTVLGSRDPVKRFCWFSQGLYATAIAIERFHRENRDVYPSVPGKAPRHGSTSVRTGDTVMDVRRHG